MLHKIRAGNSLCANPTMYDVNLTNLVFVGGSPASGDRIVTQDIAGHQTAYFPHATTGEWGRNVPTRVGNRVKNIWTPGGVIPAGTGFWYIRTTGEPLSIRFEASK